MLPAAGSEWAMYCQACGNPTEAREIDGAIRPVCVACGAVTWLDPKVVVAVVVARDGKILLGQRARNVRRPGTWSFPAGFVDRGEEVEAAARREVLEETGLAVTLGPVLGIFSEAGEPVILITYPALEAIGEPTPNDDLTELRWFDPDTFATIDLAFPHDSSILDAWQAWQVGAGDWRAARATS
ncbi:MAG: NUDIX hydrolase [Thermomicrobiales bacterium]